MGTYLRALYVRLPEKIKNAGTDQAFLIDRSLVFHGDTQFGIRSVLPVRMSLSLAVRVPEAPTRDGGRAQLLRGSGEASLTMDFIA